MTCPGPVVQAEGWAGAEGRMRRSPNVSKKIRNCMHEAKKIIDMNRKSTSFYIYRGLL